jgi:hypothetical protein
VTLATKIIGTITYATSASCQSNTHHVDVSIVHFYSVPGQNPKSKQQHKEAEHVRSKDFMERGVADSFRKAVDL